MAKPLESDTQEIQRMMYTFRVNELKELLKALNVSTGGRKRDLQERAEHLLGTGNMRFLKKVNEIYERRYGPISVVKTPPKPPISHSTAQAPPSYVIKHPDVKFKPFPFYQHVDSLIKPTALVSQSPLYKSLKTKYHDMCIQFYLTPEQVRQIYSSETTPGSYQIHVVLRFCRQETSCEQEDRYPINCCLQINNQTCPIPNYNPMYSSRPDYKCNAKPINITSYILASAAMVNTVSITWSKDILNPQGYCVSIDLMRAQSSTDLLQLLKNKSVRSSDLSRAMVKEKLTVDKDSEISATCVRVSLICPLGKMRIQHPCRAISCTHLQCFDAGTYLQMNEKKARWVCPVCDRPAPLRELILDGLIWEVCEKTSETEIEFISDGSWRPLKQNKQTTYNVNTPPTTSTSCPVTITDSPAQVSTTASESLVIDLTCDSEDETDMRHSSPEHIAHNTVTTTSSDMSHVAPPTSCNTKIRIPLDSILPATPVISASSSRVSVISHPSRKRKGYPVGPPTKHLPQFVPMSQSSYYDSRISSHYDPKDYNNKRFYDRYADNSEDSDDNPTHPSWFSYDDYDDDDDDSSSSSDDDY